jgi:drug/metabolite transporter (DMT)-like permease
VRQHPMPCRRASSRRPWRASSASCLGASARDAFSGRRASLHRRCWPIVVMLLVRRRSAARAVISRRVRSGTAAMLVNIGPILLALLGGWLLREGFPRRLAAGMATSFGGVLVAGISESDGGRTSVIGVVLCLAAAVCYAAGVVCQNLALRHARPSRSPRSAASPARRRVSRSPGICCPNSVRHTIRAGTV